MNTELWIIAQLQEIADLGDCIKPEHHGWIQEMQKVYKDMWEDSEDEGLTAPKTPPHKNRPPPSGIPQSLAAPGEKLVDFNRGQKRKISTGQYTTLSILLYFHSLS